MRPIFIMPIIILIGLVVLSIVKLGQVGNANKSDLFVGKLRPAPAIELPTLDGEYYKLSDHLGKPVIVNLWATWCAPCKLEHPLLMEMSKKAPIVGIAYKDKVSTIKSMLAVDGDPFTTVPLDSDGMVGLGLGINAVPETFLIDAKGVIVQQHRGPLYPDDAKEFLKAYDALMAESIQNLATD